MTKSLRAFSRATFSAADWRTIYEALMDAANAHHTGPASDRYLALARRVREEKLPVKPHEISEAEYIQLCEELQVLVRAWNDRHHLEESIAAYFFLQIGATMAAWGGVPLEPTMDCVKLAWETAGEEPEAG